MKLVFGKIILILTLAGFTFQSEACRFTVREIGFSVLSQTNYSLVVVDGSASWNQPEFKAMKEIARESNIQILLLDPKADASNPLLTKAKELRMSFPNAFLCRPDKEIYPLFDSSSDYNRTTLKNLFIKEVIQSPVRKQLLEGIHNTFAYVISIDGNDEARNQKAKQCIEEACKRVKDIMPLMPKEVENPPCILTLPAKNREQERILLWSLGMGTTSDEPHAIVVYGRGRFMGSALSYEQIQEETVYRYLAMIGADCECNLDRKWMLGTQLPLLWDGKVRQNLAKSLNFDVDNPSILAEMSRIMTKEVIADNSSAASFAPETIDLDEAFGSSSDKPKAEVEDEADNSMIYILFITLAVLLAVVGLVSVLILKKK